MSNKEEAFSFLRSLEDFLNRSTPGPSVISKEVLRIVVESKSSGLAPHKNFTEGAFLNQYIIPAIHHFLAVDQGLGIANATQTLLSESYRHIPRLSSGSPSRSVPHPFKKVMGAKSPEIIKQWRGNGPGAAVVQSCPDIALRNPFPHRVLLEGKFFAKGGIQAAETALVTGIYQSFFYLGLPTIAERPNHPAWDYDYACFLAYDATDEGTLLQSWQSLDPKVKRGCWEGANLYVMILRGSANSSIQPTLE